MYTQVVCQLYNANRDLAPVQLRFLHMDTYGFLMAYAKIEELLKPNVDVTHQFVLGTGSVWRAHMYNALSDPNANIAVSFTIGNGFKHLCTGHGKHYYLADDSVWSPGKFGTANRRRQINGVTTARLRIRKDRVLSYQLNIDEIERAVSVAMSAIR